MGNQRQQLKDNIASDLQNKVQTLQLNLVQLKSEHEDVEKCCTQAKNEIQKSIDIVVQQLMERKACLVKEAELLGQSEMNSLQAKIESTYLALGSIQSTLSNLDSFDTSQLLNLQLPNFLNEPYVRHNWSVNTNHDQVMEKINHWGVIEKSETEVIDVSRITDVLLDLDEINVPDDDFLKIADSSNTQEIQPVSNDGPVNKSDWMMEKWLSYQKLETSPEDFEMIFIENEFDHVSKNENNEDAVVPDMDLGDKEVFLDTHESTSDDSTSSIECIEKESEFKPVPDTFKTHVSKIDELSMWLKPKSSSVAVTPNVSSSSSIEIGPPIPPEMIQRAKSVTTSTVSTKSRFLDYPGLRLDPRCWLHKKSKAQQELFKLSAEINLNMSQKEIIPPTFAALPYPFWLKKC